MFDEQSRKRISRVVQKVERSLGNGGKPRKKYWPRAGSPQSIKIGKAVADIQPNAEGQVEIWREGVATGEFETAKLDWMHGGKKVSAGKEVLIERFADEDVWRITGAECEDA